MIAMLPRDMLSEISDNLDSAALANLSVTCKELSFLSHKAKCLVRREEVCRCANILKSIRDSIHTGVFITDKDYSECMLNTISFLYTQELDRTWRSVDPDLYDIITTYGQVHDIPLIWGFFKKCVITP